MHSRQRRVAQDSDRGGTSNHHHARFADFARLTQQFFLITARRRHRSRRPLSARDYARYTTTLRRLDACAPALARDFTALADNLLAACAPTEGQTMPRRRQ